ncbi:hypothetical protein [Algivirga pacifica]|uniref:hypothetical protein n=1 Tax=Algivirga pacifica TaxID=1162670 RepID=UPI0031E8710F
MTPAANNTYVDQLQYLIQNQNTGTPETLAKKLNISLRELCFIFEEMETHLGKPVGYSRTKKSYYFL